jgi:hypothetical protein
MKVMSLSLSAPGSLEKTQASAGPSNSWKCKLELLPPSVPHSCGPREEDNPSMNLALDSHLIQGISGPMETSQITSEDSLIPRPLLHGLTLTQ